MARPSQIARHPRAALVDIDGDTFPSGSSFHLTNICSDGHQSLSFNVNRAAAYTHFTQDTKDRKWIIEYAGHQATTVAIRSCDNNKYLAPLSEQYGSRLSLVDDRQLWYVYQGARSRSFWLSSQHGSDRFLHTWNCSGDDSTDVCIFTNRDPESGPYYGLGYDEFEQFSTGLSWCLEPTPEHREWKQANGLPRRRRSAQDPGIDRAQQEVEKGHAENQSQRAELEALRRSLDKRERDLKQKEERAHTRAQQADRRQSSLQDQEADVAAQQSSLKEKESGMHDREKELIAKEADLSQRQRSLERREEKQKIAESRLKAARNSRPAGHLALQLELDGMKGEYADVKKQLEEKNDKVKALESQLSQASTAQANYHAESWSTFRGLGFSIAPPQRLLPPRIMPERVNPSRNTLRMSKSIFSRRLEQARAS